MEDREFPCSECKEGEMIQIGDTSPNGITSYECNECGYSESFP